MWGRLERSESKERGERDGRWEGEREEGERREKEGKKESRERGREKEIQGERMVGGKN